ncbi:hypothetical protein K402DRAFT_395984 [Aulographum hederae CBS 113979]|uniref:HRDC domain-containing protein n=1 Tax=Aulographum hederae CBS 113979 TaxID=1176131 RepID=A0A6G1GSY1_9PEZI|nr:hypothetical protein K402DRAFT_395984 [Aulographum hederae CBS 113979]
MDDFAGFQKSLSQSLVLLTRATTEIAAEDVAFHRSLDPSAARRLDEQSTRLLSLAQRLLANATVGTGTPAPQFDESNDVDSNWRGVVDVLDNVLEAADTSLDEYTGAVRRGNKSEQQGQSQATPLPPGKKGWMNAGNIQKPQIFFPDKPPNHAMTPFKPLLTHKPHAVVSLEDSLNAPAPGGKEGYPHPYETEITHFQYPASIYTQAEPIPYQSYEGTSPIYVETEEALADMLGELKKAKEIAVDLEHHDLHSYIGLVCLMQISTREKDWVIDTLRPWRRNLQCLNEVFADPHILKVFHGAESDVIWLQRDFGLYLVGLFDTYHASRALGYPRHSLMYLLDRHVKFEAQKQFQRADWRIRPLPQDLLDYAKSDTHFLLYVYDNMRNELIQKSNFADPYGDKIKDVLENSKDTALQRYEYTMYDAATGAGQYGWWSKIVKPMLPLNKQQFAVYRAVHQWRDALARDLDESVIFIMNNQILLVLAYQTPVDMTNLTPLVQSASWMVKQRLGDLLAVIAKAVKEGENGPEVSDFARKPRGVGNAAAVATAPPSAAVTATAAAAALADLHATQSVFWGTAWPESKTNAASAGPALALSVPLPPLTAQVFQKKTDAIPVVDSPTPFIDPGARAEHPYIKSSDRFSQQQEQTPDPRNKDNTFILSQFSNKGGSNKKRKATEAFAADANEHGKDQMFFVDNEGDKVFRGLKDDEDREKARKMKKKDRSEAKKKFKKEKERERAAARQTSSTHTSNAAEGGSAEMGMDISDDESASGGGEEGMKPFDYANAPKVLDKPHERENARKRGREAFNPYRKAQDAPKGLPRVQSEREGKSGTFGR